MQYTQVEVENRLAHQTTRNFNYHTTGDIDTYTREGGFAGKKMCMLTATLHSSPPSPLKLIIKRSEEEARTNKIHY